MLTSNSLAAVTAAGVINKSFAPSPEVLARKLPIVATFDPLKVDVVPDVPVLVTSPEDVGDKMGFGFMAHRLAQKAFKGSGSGVPVYIIPQDEVAGAQATGDVDFTGTAGVLAGTVHMFISNDYVPFDIADAATDAEIASAAAAAINAIKELSVTASAALAVLTIDAKTTGTYGNDISIKFNLDAGQAFPTGVVAVITDMATGAGVPDISTALDGMGTGTDANEDFFTDLVHGYGLDTDTLNDIEAYVGPGNTFTGLWDTTVARPFRALTGDNTADQAGLDALIVISDTRLDDRSQGVIAVPGSVNHPSEIAAQAIGAMALINNSRAEETAIDIVLDGIRPGDKADRWTSDYLKRDLAVKSGISPTDVKRGVVIMQNMVTFYRPAAVPVESNGYRSMRNISISQNVLNSIVVTFSQPKWMGNSIVEDVRKVSNVESREKARDVNSVREELVNLTQNTFMARAWIYTDTFTLDKLKDADAVKVRANNNGFDNLLSLLYSGEGGILNTVAEFDASIAVLN